MGSLQNFYPCSVDFMAIYIEIRYYLRRCIEALAIVVCRDMQTLFVRFYYYLYIHLLYLGKWFAKKANALCSNASILHCLFHYYLNVQISYLHRSIVRKLGQCAFIRCKHPSSPNLFYPKYSIFSLPRLMVYKLCQCALLRFKHPS